MRPTTVELVATKVALNERTSKKGNTYCELFVTVPTEKWDVAEGKVVDTVDQYKVMVFGRDVDTAINWPDKTEKKIDVVMHGGTYVSKAGKKGMSIELTLDRIHVQAQFEGIKKTESVPPIEDDDDDCPF